MDVSKSHTMITWKDANGMAHKTTRKVLADETIRRLRTAKAQLKDVLQMIDILEGDLLRETDREWIELEDTRS